MKSIKVKGDYPVFALHPVWRSFMNYELMHAVGDYCEQKELESLCGMLMSNSYERAVGHEDLTLNFTVCAKCVKEIKRRQRMSEATANHRENNMNLDRLYKILGECTMQLRKGEEIEGTPELVEQIKRGEELTAGGVAEIYAMPHVNEARPDIEKVDVEFVVIGVDKAKAEEHRAEFISILKQWPNPERLAAGPSYIEVGGEIGDQGAAFQLFALGKVLRLWDIITPKTLGVTGAVARQMAGTGFVMMSPFDVSKAA